MGSVFENLRSARTSRLLKQSEVAARLGCAATSLTNWESGKVMPSLEVLSKLCDIYGISPLSLLEKEYSYYDIVEISEKPIPERSYEEQVALNFSYPILNKLRAAEAQRQETARAEATATFLKENDILTRFGQMSAEEIAAVKKEYDEFDSVDKDILFAYHALTLESKRAFLSMLTGLLSGTGNTQSFSEHMGQAAEYTRNRLDEARDALND